MKTKIYFLFFLLLSSCGNPLGDKSKTDSSFLPGISGLPPTITSVSPSAGTITGGTTLTINGTNFVSGATVQIGGSACTNVIFVSSSELQCTSPAGSAGIVSATVVNPDTQTVTKTAAFEYSSSLAGGTSYAVLFGGGVSSGGTIRLEGSAGEKGTPFVQTGAGARHQSGIQGVLLAP